MLAAQARGDHAEIVSLWTSCPKMEVIAPDPTFSRVIHGVLLEVRSVILQWVEVSHYVVRDRFLATALEADDDSAARTQDRGAVEAREREMGRGWSRPSHASARRLNSRPNSC